MDVNRDTIIDWTSVSADAGRAGYRPPKAPGVRSYVTLGAGLVAIYVGLLVVGLAVRPAGTAGGSAEPSAMPSGPVSDSATDGTFQLLLVTPLAVYRPDQTIAPVARLTYLGPDPSTTVYHGESAVVFSIAEVGGTRSMPGGIETVCASTTLNRNEPILLAFQKGGSPDQGGFDRAWYEDRVLRLPTGTWDITATLEATTAKGSETCGGTPHQVKATNRIVVAAGLTPSGTAPTSTPSAQPTPSAALSADASAAQTIVRTYVDALTTGQTDKRGSCAPTRSMSTSCSTSSSRAFERPFGSPISSSGSQIVG